MGTRGRHRCGRLCPSERAPAASAWSPRWPFGDRAAALTRRHGASAPRWPSPPRPTRRAAGRPGTAQPAGAASGGVGAGWGASGPGGGCRPSSVSAVPPQPQCPRDRRAPCVTTCASSRGTSLAVARVLPSTVPGWAPRPALPLAAPVCAPCGAEGWPTPGRRPLPCARPSPTLLKPVEKPSCFYLSPRKGFVVCAVGHVSL